MTKRHHTSTPVSDSGKESQTSSRIAPGVTRFARRDRYFVAPPTPSHAHPPPDAVIPPAKALLAACATLAAAALAAQRTPGFVPMVCGPDADMELLCLDACIICDIDGFTGRNDNGGAVDEGDMPQGFCTTINHNIQWIGFLATDRELTLRLTVTDCENASNGGLEAGVYYVEECDRAGATPVATCNSEIPNGTSTDFAMTDLVAGQYYYFVIDGNDGGICDYRIDVVQGSTRVPDLAFRQNQPVDGPHRVCPGATHDYTGEAVRGAPIASWTVDGAAVGGASESLTRALTFPDVAHDTVEVCYTARNLCNEVQHCFDVVVGDPGTDVDVALCRGGSATVDGVTFDAAGSFPVTRTNQAGCDSVVTYHVTVGPPPVDTVDHAACFGACATVDGLDYCADATFETTYADADGCERVVVHRVSIGAEPTPETRDVVLCDGLAVTRDGLTFTAADTAAPRRVTEPTAAGCPRDVTYVVTVAPHRVDTLTYAFCTGQALEVDGVVYPGPGAYPRPAVASAAGCDSVVVVRVVQDECPFTGAATARDARCHGAADGAVVVEVAGDHPPYTLQLERGGEPVGEPATRREAAFAHTFPDLAAGRYEVVVRDALGSREAFGASVAQPTPLTLALATPAGKSAAPVNGGYDLACAGDRTGTLTALPGGGTPPYDPARWADGPAAEVRVDLPAGDYAAAVADAHGCTAAAAAVLTEPAPLAAAVEAFDRGCDEGEPGGLVVADLAGGVAPYRYRLDDDGPAVVVDGTAATVTPVAPGPHALTLVDANGCALERAATVGSLRPADVTPGPTRTVLRGQSAALAATSTQAGATFAWEPAVAPDGTLSCAACPRPLAQPDTTTLYRVTAVNADGCAAVAEQLVVVEIDRSLWAPNAISPNGDDSNDGFTVFASDPGSVIEELRVFDRWGNEVYVDTDVPTNDPATGWDGTTADGERRNSAVFVFWARVRASDGETQLLSGDVTVVR